MGAILNVGTALFASTLASGLLLIPFIPILVLMALPPLLLYLILYKAMASSDEERQARSR